MEDQSDNFILGEETGAIIGCAIEVVNQLGHGLLEKPYENALTVEFGLRGIPCRRQPKYNVFYKNIQVGEYIPDLIVFDEIVVEVKTIKKITNHEVGQVLNYLRLTGLRVGIILNFKYSRLQWRRLIL